jgi:hypothetical protein
MRRSRLARISIHVRRTRCNEAVAATPLDAAFEGAITRAAGTTWNASVVISVNRCLASWCAGIKPPFLNDLVP